METDHIFIFSDKGKETEELLNLGLTEGSGRKHAGIGTVNRRIFFENFYLEILWVQNKTEAESVDKLGIWERSNFRNNKHSRFGLCIKNTKETDTVFENAIKWKPDFLPEGQFVDILTNERMPWIFRFPANKKKKSDENREHKNQLKNLTKAVFKLRHTDFETQLAQIRDNSIIEFEQSDKEFLILEFDHAAQGKSRRFDKLSLQIDY